MLKLLIPLQYLWIPRPLVLQRIQGLNYQFHVNKRYINTNKRDINLKNSLNVSTERWMDFIHDIQQGFHIIPLPRLQIGWTLFIFSIVLQESHVFVVFLKKTFITSWSGFGPINSPSSLSSPDFIFNFFLETTHWNNYKDAVSEFRKNASWFYASKPQCI